MANLIKFAFVGDTHGHIENMPRLIYQYNQFKQQHPEMISLFTGDFIGTTIESVYSQGHLDLSLLKKIYDQDSVMTLGNHDFDFGEQQLYDFLKELGNHIVVTNIRYKKEKSNLKQLINKHYALQTAGGLIVFFGLLPYEMKTTSDQLQTIEVLSYEDSLAALRKEMTLFKHSTSPVGFVILSHLGIDVDKVLAEEISHSLILGGHSHTLLPLYLSSNKETAVAHAGSNAQYIGVINASLEQVGFTQFSEDFVTVKEDTQKEEQAAAEVKSLTAKIYATEGIDLGEQILKLNLNRRLSGLEWNEILDSHQGHARYNDTFITRTLCDAMLAAINAQAKMEVDVAFFHGGGVRSYLPPDVITYRDIHNVFPYPQYLVLLELTGKEILNELEIGVSMTNWHQRSGLLQPSKRFQYAYDARKVRGSRIENVFLDGKPLELTKKYKVVTNSWVGAGKEGHPFFEKYWREKKVTLFPQLLQFKLFLNYLREQKNKIEHQEFRQGYEVFGQRITASPSLDASEIISKDPRFVRGKEMILQIDMED